MKEFNRLDPAADFFLNAVGKEICLATPLGLGKPNAFLNVLYARIARDLARRLRLFTALSLHPPQFTDPLARRFFEPFARRQWGENYPLLAYAEAALSDSIPAHIEVHEFYFQAGTALKSQHLQRHYQSVNYTHVAEEVVAEGLNAIVQLVAVRVEADGRKRYSLSCNPDVTLDVVESARRHGRKLVIVGVVHHALPFLEGDPEVGPEFFDAIVDAPESQHELFALPREPITREENLIGMYASLLMPDEGTIQVGIGSLGESIAAALDRRHNHGAGYVKLAERLKVQGETKPFVKGLYGLTEMLTDGYMHLRRSGILRREVVDERSGARTFLHASFFLGSKPFYEWLRTLSPEEARGLRMTRVSKVNDLYDPHETLLRRQRVHARFYNTAMQVTLLGEAMSETLPDGSVVSGVGGQYNFVAMSRELEGARSVLLLRSTRIDHRGRRTSNIVWTPGHVTIPRHLRDLVVTEYGIADLRGKSDEECIVALLQVCDHEFQDELLRQAQRAGKIRSDYILPERCRANRPENLAKIEREFPEAFKPFPFGSDFTPVEERLVLALTELQKDAKRSRLRVISRLLRGGPSDAEALQRLGLLKPRGLMQWLNRRLILGYLR